MPIIFWLSLTAITFKKMRMVSQQKSGRSKTLWQRENEGKVDIEIPEIIELHFLRWDFGEEVFTF